jgi:hypothetical protein
MRSYPRRDRRSISRAEDMQIQGPSALSHRCPRIHDAGMRIVVEHENPLVAGGIAEDLEAAGHTVVRCYGPSQRGGRECPVLEDRACPLIEDADVVLAALPIDQLSVYVGVRAQYAIPVVLSLSRTQREQLRVLQHIGPWIPRELHGPQLAHALEDAAGRRTT